jgi:hypothetical protein
MTLPPNAKGGDPARAAVVIGAVPAETGTLVYVPHLGLHRLKDWDNSVIKALVNDETAYGATVTPGGLDIDGLFTANPAAVVSEGLQWMLVEHDDAGAPHSVFVMVEGRWGNSGTYAPP